MDEMELYCQVCSEGPRWYLCPACRKIRYCSVICYKAHISDCSPTKEHNVPDEQSCKLSEETTSTSANSSLTVTDKKPTLNILESEDFVSEEKLRLLDSPQLKSLLSQKQLRDLLLVIDCSDQPAEMLQKAMQSIDFQRFAEVCLNIVEPPAANLVDQQVFDMPLENYSNTENSIDCLRVFEENLRDLIND